MVWVFHKDTNWDFLVHGKDVGSKIIIAFRLHQFLLDQVNFFCEIIKDMISDVVLSDIIDSIVSEGKSERLMKKWSLTTKWHKKKFAGDLETDKIWSSRLKWRSLVHRSSWWRLPQALSWKWNDVRKSWKREILNRFL